MLESFAEIEKLAAGGKLLAARRVESSNIWRRTGHRSAEAHVAEAAGTGLGPAITTLETARHLGSLPATDEAMRLGLLSESQVKEIAGGPPSNPTPSRSWSTQRQAPMSALELRRPVQGDGSRPGGHLPFHPPRPLPAQLDRPRGGGAVRRPADPRPGARLLAAVSAETSGWPVRPYGRGWTNHEEPWPPTPSSAWPPGTPPKA